MKTCTYGETCRDVTATGSGRRLHHNHNKNSHLKKRVRASQLLPLLTAALAGCAASPETVESYAWLAVAVLAAVVVFPLALPVAASFFGGGYIPLRAAAKVALGVVASIAFGVGVGLVMHYRFGFGGLVSSAAGVSVVMELLRAWAARLDGSDDDDQD